MDTNFNSENLPPMPERLARTAIYENPWVNLYVDKVRFPGGRVIEEHHVLEFDKEAVAVIVENQQGDILFVHSYRYVTGSLEWEVPAGAIEPGETVVEAAQRETYEETGYLLDDVDVYYTYHPMNGIANKTFHIAHAQVKDRFGYFDSNEVRTVTWFSRIEIQSMIRNQTIRDGFSLTALLLHFDQYPI